MSFAARTRVLRGSASRVVSTVPCPNSAVVQRSPISRTAAPASWAGPRSDSASKAGSIGGMDAPAGARTTSTGPRTAYARTTADATHTARVVRTLSSSAATRDLMTSP